MKKKNAKVVKDVGNSVGPEKIVDLQKTFMVPKKNLGWSVLTSLKRAD